MAVVLSLIRFSWSCKKAELNHPFSHAVNQGKGRALKTAFNYCLLQDPDLVGCVTADSDGQHLPEDIVHCGEVLSRHPDSLVLGCRDFDDVSVPQKSRYGNKITRTLFRYLCGLKITDTQTGLRGIPAPIYAGVACCSRRTFWIWNEYADRFKRSLPHQRNKDKNHIRFPPKIMQRILIP